MIKEINLEELPLKNGIFLIDFFAIKETGSFLKSEKITNASSIP